MIELARQAARGAGALLRARPPLRVDHKSAVDLVTQVDLASEARILELLGPSGLPVLAEEGGGASTARDRWIVDPLDGTTNYVHGFPFYCVSIALELDGALALGVVYDPVRDLLYEAQAGQGAWVGDQPLRVSGVSALDHALVASGFAYDRRTRADDYLRFIRVFLERAQGFRRAGAAALDLCMVASGVLDGFWEFNLSPWDVAAGALIVQEAGGRVTDMDGGPLTLDAPRVLATNGLIHTEMRDIIGPLLPLNPRIGG